MKAKIIIAGGGAAGMFASIMAAKHGCDIAPAFSGNEKLLSQLLIFLKHVNITTVLCRHN